MFAGTKSNRRERGCFEASGIGFTTTSETIAARLTTKAKRTSPKAVEDETPDALVQRWEVARTLREILDELNETDRTLVKLKYFEGLRYREISTRTGLSVSNVGYRLHHILKGIAERLRPLGIDGTS